MLFRSSMEFKQDTLESPWNKVDTKEPFSWHHIPNFMQNGLIERNIKIHIHAKKAENSFKLQPGSHFNFLTKGKMTGSILKTGKGKD